jgi:L-aspartate oxidase
MKHSDYLVIGSGVAGLSLSLKIADRFPLKKVTIVTKGDEDESNTKYAQGGVAVVSNAKKDSFDKHVNDTLIAGDGLCDIDIVKMVVRRAPKCISQLISWGVEFDLDQNGKLDLGMEGGHSESRVVHHKDLTGKEIELSLLKRAKALPNIEFLSHHFVIDLITESKDSSISCCGAKVLNQRQDTIMELYADNTVIASGGAGQVYAHSTNPLIATGDGVAIAVRAGATTRNMEFVQFHPTALEVRSKGPAFLITEALRGFGAHLRNKGGKRFMLKYHEAGELASRDIVSRAIDLELRIAKSKEVYLDCTHLESSALKSKFPNIHKVCSKHGIDISKDWIPVAPAAHYLCGGIEVDKDGRSSIENLFACGECTYTGLHGANRLASNAILEALVYSSNIFKYLSQNEVDKRDFSFTESSQIDSDKPDARWITAQVKKLQSTMTQNVGIIRNMNSLELSSKTLLKMKSDISIKYPNGATSTGYFELKNMIDISFLIVDQSLRRKENKGGYFNTDLLARVEEVKGRFDKVSGRSNLQLT